jgi:hypothetical protein
MQHENLAGMILRDHLGDPGEIVAMESGVTHDEIDVVERTELRDRKCSWVYSPVPVRDGSRCLGRLGSLQRALRAASLTWTGLLEHEY